MISGLLVLAVVRLHPVEAERIASDKGIIEAGIPEVNPLNCMIGILWGVSQDLVLIY
jgi:hypothetical protein